jgi:anti-sigma regulatory factor (Ser/Thr protein kinase)
VIALIDDECGAPMSHRYARILEKSASPEQIQQDEPKRLAAAPSEAGEARKYALRVLNRTGVTDDSHNSTVELLISELSTNAIRAAQRFGRLCEPGTEPVEDSVLCRPWWTHIIVSDPDPAIPEPIEAVPDYEVLDLDSIEESGRGLGIVAALGAFRWWERLPGGKEAHVVVALPGYTLRPAECLLLKKGITL